MSSALLIQIEKIADLKLRATLEFPPPSVHQSIWLTLVAGLEGRAYLALFMACCCLLHSLLVVVAIGNIEVDSLGYVFIRPYL